MERCYPIGIRLLTRNGADRSPRYPQIIEAVNLSSNVATSQEAYRSPRLHRERQRLRLSLCDLMTVSLSPLPKSFWYRPALARIRGSGWGTSIVVLRPRGPKIRSVARQEVGSAETRRRSWLRAVLRVFSCEKALDAGTSGAFEVVSEETEPLLLAPAVVISSSPSWRRAWAGEIAGSHSIRITCRSVIMLSDISNSTTR
jgi:hypothetical protein